jgi:Protein of unknown function (DUF3634)
MSLPPARANSVGDTRRAGYCERSELNEPVDDAMNEYVPSLFTTMTVATIALSWAVLRRANELCAIRVRDGASHLARGRAPARFLADVEEIVKRANISSSTLRVVVESGVPRLLVPSDLSADVVQQLRNAVGQHQVLHFRSGRRAT